MSNPLPPNLFVIGAMKAGTTTLHRLLGLHPLVSMSRIKEPCYFIDSEELTQFHPTFAKTTVAGDWEKYLNLFDPSPTIRYRGEASTLYSAYPQFTGVPERIHKVAPNARFLYVLRDPLERVVSHLTMDQWNAWGGEGGDRLESPLYLALNEYQTQWDRFAAFFPKEQMRLIDFRQLVAEPRQTVEEIFCWLGLPPLKEFPTHRIRKNPAWLHYYENRPWMPRLRETSWFQALRKRISWGNRQRLKQAWYLGVGGWKTSLLKRQVRQTWSEALKRQRKDMELLLHGPVQTP